MRGPEKAAHPVTSISLCLSIKSDAPKVGRLEDCADSSLIRPVEQALPFTELREVQLVGWFHLLVCRRNAFGEQHVSRAELCEGITLAPGVLAVVLAVD
jgi:hypothetical protein